MNSELMETWGRFLIAAAQLQEQFERMSQQAGDWCEGVGALMKPWSGASFSEEAQKDSFASDPSRSGSGGESLGLYGNYLRSFGLVPLRDYLELAREHEELKSKCAALETALKELSPSRGNAPLDSYELITKQFQECATKQAEACREVMEKVAKSFSPLK